MVLFLGRERKFIKRKKGERSRWQINRVIVKVIIVIHDTIERTAWKRWSRKRTQQKVQRMRGRIDKRERERKTESLTQIPHNTWQLNGIPNPNSDVCSSTLKNRVVCGRSLIDYSMSFIPSRHRMRIRKTGSCLLEKNEKHKEKKKRESRNSS